MMLKFVLEKVSLIVFTIPLYFNKTLHIRSTVSPSESGQERMRNVPRRSVTYARELSRTTTTPRTKLIGFHIV